MLKGITNTLTNTQKNFLFRPSEKLFLFNSFHPVTILIGKTYLITKKIRKIQTMAQSNVALKEGSFMNTRGFKLYSKYYTPRDKNKIKALVFLVYGYSDHLNSPKNVIKSTYLCERNYAVFTFDHQGHGKSEGLVGYIDSFNSLIDDTLLYIDIIRKEYGKDKKVFILGESMGGAIALKIAINNLISVDGYVLVAPMCKISPKVQPPFWVIPILKAMSYIFPTLALIPDGIPTQSYKLPEKARETLDDPLCYNGYIRLATGRELLDITFELGARLEKVLSPFIVVHGKNDCVTEWQLSQELYERSKAGDKEIKLYDDMYHNLFDEPPPNPTTVLNDMVTWLDKRV